MMDEIERLADQIKDKKLRKNVLQLLRNPTLDLEYQHLPIEECPAGAYQHHSYVGGLLQHTIGVAKLSMTLCELVEEVYGGKVDRDTVLASALIHDLMKIYTYEPRGDGSYISSPLGERLDHLTLLVAELIKRGFPVDVVHAVASHHGDVSPVKPKTMEALIVSIADLADSELSRKTLRAAEYLLRQMGESQLKLNSSRAALDLVQAKNKDGWDGVRKLSNSKN